MVIFLVGFMGSGKNWWGSVLAEQTGVPFYDLDEAVEQAEGMDIVSIFREKGESYFREAESRMLKELAAKIISAGDSRKCIDSYYRHRRRHALF